MPSKKRLWRAAGIDPARAGGGSWYRDIGGGMGAVLNTASAMGAYTLVDRAPGSASATKETSPCWSKAIRDC